MEHGIDAWPSKAMYLFWFSRLFKYAHEVLVSGFSLKMEREHRSNGKNVARITDGSLCSSDVGEDSWFSTCVSSSSSGSYDKCRFSGTLVSKIGTISESLLSDRCSDVDLESGTLESKVHSVKADKDCRICHLSLESANQESGIPIELGCSCKDDLAAAHKQCAEAWFKIKGNQICEICGATARNVVTITESEITEQLSETISIIAAPQAETRSFWHGSRFLNFLLACMVFALVISWLFHLNGPS